MVTGAASGLGLADTRVLTREGARVVMTDIDREAGQAHADDLGATFSLKTSVMNPLGKA